MEKFPGFAYLAPLDFTSILQEELQNITHIFDRLILAKGPLQKVFWAQNIWYEPYFFSFASISEAYKKLSSIQRNWALYPYEHHRRAHLIQENLPYLSSKPLEFFAPLPKSPLGSWTLLEKNHLLLSSSCSSLFPNGELHFKETKIPPSRAYLKLWEIFTLLQKKPQKEDVCIEIGASPGSWTWVLQSLGCKVYAFDKAPLDSSIAKLPNVFFEKKNGFSVLPKDFPKVDFVFSDVICFPEKLFAWLEIWLKECPHANFICTIKFQGKTDHAMVQKFSQIQDAQVFHLFNNKHELTFVKLANRTFSS